jgi:hypothetical protein
VHSDGPISFTRFSYELPINAREEGEGDTYFIISWMNKENGGAGEVPLEQDQPAAPLTSDSMRKPRSEVQK